MKRNEYDPIVRQTNEELRQLIDAGLFDLDDALIYTSEIYRLRMAEYVEAVAGATGIDEEILASRLKIINDEEYMTAKVNPRRWEVVAKRLAGEFPQAAAAIFLYLPIIYKIYKTEPRLRSGATSILSGLRSGGFKIGIVTHSPEDWAMWKLKMTGLWEYHDAVVVADQDGDKTSEHWRRCAEMLGVSGNRCFVLGDNLRGDIIEGMKIGAYGIWMPSPWSVYRQGVVPKGVVEIGELEEFYDGVKRLV